MRTLNVRMLKTLVVASVSAVVLSGCSISPYDIPFPGGADTGSHPINIKVEFRDVLDLVPQSGVRVHDSTVGKVTDIKLKGWTAVITLQVNRDAKVPANAVASIRQTSLLGEKFVSLDAPPTGAVGLMKDGGNIPLSRSGRNPELEEVLSAASLLFNGGALDKTRTIVRELNNTLDGNESEVKGLLVSANAFVSQLDANKAGLLSSLEKVNNLAVETNKQTGAITGALDNLPGALKVVNEQRDDLVKLLEALNKLGDVGTNVVKDSKADTVADLKALAPVLRQLAASGDDLAKSVATLLTFPFTDGSVGGPTVQGAKDFHYGDYFNLNLSLDLSLDQVTGILGLGNGVLGGAAAPGAASTSTTDPLSSLADLVGGLVPKTSTGSSLPGATSSPSPGATSSPSTSGPNLPQLCSLLGSCRVASANLSDAAATDLGRLLLEPLVAS